MLGFVTAMETFCGQAFGARRYALVGVVLQRGLAVSGLYCCAALLMWGRCEAALVAMGQVRAWACNVQLWCAAALLIASSVHTCQRSSCQRACTRINGLCCGCRRRLLCPQDAAIASAASRFTLALAPALFMDAADQCCRRYLAAQAVVQPLMVVTLLATLLTPLYLWLFVARCVVA